MKSFAMAIQKGGTGKTSLSVPLAAELGKHGETVLIDLDPQGQASTWTAPGLPKHELANVLYGRASLKDALMETKIEGVFLLPTAAKTGQLKLYMDNEAHGKLALMRVLLADLTAIGFKYAVLDMCPAFGSLEKATYIAVSEIITPVTPDTHGVDGLETFISLLGQFKKEMDMVNIQISPWRMLIFNAVDNRLKEQKEYMQDIQTKMPHLIYYKVPVDQVFHHSQTAKKMIQEKEMGAKPETLDAITHISEEFMKE